MLTLALILEALSREHLDLIGKGGRPSDQQSEAILGLLQRPVAGAIVDSRQAYKDTLFVALPGERVDGHDYIVDAFQRGSRLALIQNPPTARLPFVDLRGGISEENLWLALREHDPEGAICLLVDDSLKGLQTIARFWRRKLNIRVIGITGSVGKSTTKEIIADVMSQRYRTLKSLGNLNNEIGLPLTLLSLNEAYECAVLEMGFYVPGEIAFLCDIAQPQVGVVTLIGPVHAERAGSIEEIAKGKAELVQSLPAAPEGVAVLNYDDPWVRWMAGLTHARVFYYGLTDKANLWADNIEGLGLEGIRFQIHYRKESLNLRVPLIGQHSVQTVLRAVAVGLVEGLTWQEIVNGLRSERTQLRLMTGYAQNGALILDDTYNASPESMLAALNLLDELDGRKIAVLGDMLELGQYEKEGHETIGARAAEVVNLLVTVGERSKMIDYSAWQAGLSRKYISHFSTTDEVVDYLKEILTPDDVVLIKGSRGMEMERIVSALEASE
jgi:UDP-N-acetylmuramoyl-tripeptide--D-alanyl-D-alanine ligase